MNLKCGIVGLPNVGKSPLFNALTRAGIAADNYPFCTIEPNVGIVQVPDLRLEVIAEIAQPQKVVPAVVEFVDIAGLVAGASKGEGLGNQFLASIRETDAIAHVVRCFDDPNVIHVAGRVDPASDIGTINTELALADLDAVERQLAKHEKVAQTGGDEEAQRLVSVLKKVGQALDAGLPARSAELSKEERVLLRPLFLLTMKPVIYVANLGEQGSQKLLEQVEAYAAKEGAPVVPISASIEALIADMPEEDKKLFLEDMGMDDPGLNRVIRAAYQLLGLHTYFTAGPKEARAWTIPAGATPPPPAGAVPTDFERGFTRAEGASDDAFAARGGGQGAKEAGQRRREGQGGLVRGLHRAAGISRPGNRHAAARVRDTTGARRRGAAHHAAHRPAERQRAGSLPQAGVRQFVDAGDAAEAAKIFPSVTAKGTTSAPSRTPRSSISRCSERRL